MRDLGPRAPVLSPGWGGGLSPYPQPPPGLSAVLAALEPSGGWLVGGAVRDRLLGRVTSDYDVVVDGDVRLTARSLARAVRAHAFELSEQFGAWRIVPRSGGGANWQLDLLPLLHGSIESDLAQRDLTINALAQPLGGDEVVDPFGGVEDLAALRLRMVSADAFERDALRVLRLVRLACELGFEVDAPTAAAAREAAGGLSGVAPERVFEELRRVVCAEQALRGLGLMEQLGVTEAVLPELAELRGIEQSRFHHLDVHAHTLAVLGEAIELERTPRRHLGRCWEEVDAFLRTPLANGLTRWQALRFGALLHDIAKPQTRAVSVDGRVTFMGHDQAGADAAAEILRRLRTSERLREHVAGLARHHLRLGFLVHEVPLPRRRIYRYLHDCGPVAVDVTVLSVADRLATRGDRSEAAIAAHLELADQMLCEAMRWIEQPPRPPVRGDDLAAVLGVAPGPALGEILAQLEEAAFAEEISSRDDAIRLARELLGARSSAADDR